MQSDAIAMRDVSLTCLKSCLTTSCFWCAGGVTTLKAPRREELAQSVGVTASDAQPLMMSLLEAFADEHEGAGARAAEGVALPPAKRPAQSERQGLAPHAVKPALAPLSSMPVAVLETEEMVAVETMDANAEAAAEIEMPAAEEAGASAALVAEVEVEMLAAEAEAEAEAEATLEEGTEDEVVEELDEESILSASSSEPSAAGSSQAPGPEPAAEPAPAADPAKEPAPEPLAAPKPKRAGLLGALPDVRGAPRAGGLAPLAPLGAGAGAKKGGLAPLDGLGGVAPLGSSSGVAKRSGSGSSGTPMSLSAPLGSAPLSAPTLADSIIADESMPARATAPADAHDDVGGSALAAMAAAADSGSAAAAVIDDPLASLPSEAPAAGGDRSSDEDGSDDNMPIGFDDAPADEVESEIITEDFEEESYSLEDDAASGLGGMSMDLMGSQISASDRSGEIDLGDADLVESIDADTDTALSAGFGEDEADSGFGGSGMDDLDLPGL